MVDVNHTAATADELIQEEHYYPFGLRMNGGWEVQTGGENAYQFNGIERVGDFGLGWEVAHFRTYDATLGRWGQVDPKASERQSAYVGMGNSPFKIIDMLGDTDVVIHSWASIKYEHFAAAKRLEISLINTQMVTYKPYGAQYHEIKESVTTTQTVVLDEESRKIIDVENVTTSFKTDLTIQTGKVVATRGKHLSSKLEFIDNDFEWGFDINGGQLDRTAMQKTIVQFKKHGVEGLFMPHPLHKLLADHNDLMAVGGAGATAWWAFAKKKSFDTFPAVTAIDMGLAAGTYIGAFLNQFRDKVGVVPLYKYNLQTNNTQDIKAFEIMKKSIYSIIR